MMKYVYSFKDGDKDMKDILGGKGANLAEMTNLSLPIPKGFTISTRACLKYYEENETINDNILDEINTNIRLLEKETGKEFGSIDNPLLVSVRSGARASMPGMMDTILNLGLNEEIINSYDDKDNNNRYIFDSYRRLIGMYADVVIGASKGTFEGILDKFKKEKNIKLDNDMSIKDLKELIKIYKDEYKKITGKYFPEDVYFQLYEAVKAVFKSWNNDRAITYRRLNDIPDDWGTAVNVQEMVYGNKNELSGTGVAFTRNPATGENKLFGEYLINAQGEDVVAGIRTPQPIDTLKDIMPEVYDQFYNISKRLEEYYRDMQDMEFTIEDGKLYILQTRNGKRTATAAVKIATSLTNEGIITKEEAMFRVDPKSLGDLLHDTFKTKELENAKVISKGLGASPGCSSGMIYFNAKDALIEYKKNKTDIILVRNETSPEDIEGMNIATGLLTLRGGMTSHAAVVARGMGTACVCGCSGINIDTQEKILTTTDGKTYKEKDYISIDGSSGYVYEGIIAKEKAKETKEFITFMKWVDEIRRLKVYTNADTPKDAKVALDFGAEGIGLCRTEHMFFDEERIFNFRKMILSKSKEEREKYLENILPYQEEDFYNIYKVMKDKPVTIRLLDPPLHEFLPKTESEIKKLSQQMNIEIDEINERIAGLKEFNPMMGHRGCRLGITYPEIIIMQTKAIISAAIRIKEDLNITVIPKIMIPLVSDDKELKYIKDIIENVVNDIGFDSKYMFGTMIELPRACMIADDIAKVVDFISFGTNDLTQMTFGFSRDDAEVFLKDYYDKGILEKNPFVTLDLKAVGRLVKIATEKARSVNKNIELGICGEHGADDKSIDFCHHTHLNYVSSSPYRVIMARLSAARATLNTR